MDETSSNQMERPSRPKDAISAERSSEDQGSVPSPDPPSTRPSTRPSSDPPSKRSSPELPSTRPNPFDEGDVLARKRRRTSGSASPPSPALPRGEAHAASLSNHVNVNASEPSANDAIPAVQVAESLHTPRTPVNFLPFDCAPNSSTPPSSSKVTLNLKNSNGLAVDALQPSSPSNMRPASDIVTDSRSHTEAETTDYNTGQQPQMPAGASPKSTSDSISPPVELIVVSDADSEEGNDDMVLSYEENATGFGGNEFSSLNPILQFPFSEPDDDPSAPLHRVLDYLSTQSSIDSKIITQVQAWIEDYLQFAGSTEPSIVRDSREAYRTFWLVLPNVMFHLSIRSSDLCKIPELRNSIIDFYSSFTCLAARMVALDALAIKDWQTTSKSDCRQCPELFSPKYLQQLHEVLSPDHSGANSQNEAQNSSGWPRQHEIESYLIGRFQDSPGGSVDDLSQLASFIASLLPEYPRLVDALAPLAQIFAACIRKAALTTGHDQDAGRVRQIDAQLEAGHLVWLHLSDGLDLMIEKHVTRLSTETAIALLNAASEILKCALRGSHQQAMDELQEHMRVFPNLPITHTVEAMAWKWSVGVLERLIRSGQMQLRVMAIAKLCGDLVHIWQTAGNASDEDTSLFIEHLGNHLLQTHLVDYIFGSNCHPEIIVESANVLGFLIVTKMYNQQHTDRLWQGLTGRQDSHVAEALARMITSITGLLDYSGLVAWCEKFQTLPLAGFSLSMRTLWESLMENMIKRCQSEQRIPTLHPFKLCLRLLREASICTQGCQTADAELQFAAMQKLRELLVLGPSPEDRGTLFVSCIDDIAKKSSTSLGSLWCLSMAIRGTVPRDLQVLTEQHDLARLVIEELAHAIGAGRQAGAIAVLSGDSNMPRRDLIMNIIHLQPSAIEDELGTRLLDILVGPDSSCEEDRAAGWLVILSVMKQSSLKNSFLQTCFSKYLPSLPASCFSDGMLDFVRERALSLAGDNSDFALDDSESLSTSGLEQLWRIILEADDSPLVARAICTLAVDLYLESNAMRRCPMPRARRVHLSLVSRCMDQMKSAATWIRGSVEGVSGNNDVRLTTAPKDVELRRQELIFRRSLQLLKFFLEKHQAHPRFSVPDLRPFMASALNKTVGCSAELKFQAFDGCDQSSIHHLEIGRQNTVACLLAEIQRATGFENYRIYYRGQQWCPSENQIGLTLYELHIQDDIMLIKREEDISSTAEGMKPGSSQLEIEILSHFKELWEYLGMEEQFAEDIYDFLAQLPADGEFTARFDSNDASYLDIFHKGYPFRTLYAIHAIGDYVEAAQYQREQADLDAEGASERLGSFQQAIEKSLRLVVDAIADPELLDGVSPALRLRIAGSLVRIYVKIFTVATQKTPRVELESGVLPSATRLYEIICLAKEHDGDDSSLALIDHTCAAILRVGSESLDFWNAVISKTKILELIANLVLKDPRKLVKQTVAELVEDATSAHTNTLSVVHTEDLTNGKQESHYMLVSLCSAMIAILPECTDHQSEPEEYFRLMLHLLEQSQKKCSSAIDIESLAVTTLDMLLQHTSMEAS
ncbi:hypothetical protein E4U30_001701 [Claviceps sp. LM220 group G6]|nr:hypothetical protein E4U15_005921 [Claviceps sp. LM218 group G6]KAG6096187.1 hypothetical protein E4U30_001701 [Claviceps sp. LM220 group G6]KAG6096491.1 hypothetical protein E4U31_005428 [Claviceps sp. LM219 group G6]